MRKKFLLLTSLALAGASLQAGAQTADNLYPCDLSGEKDRDSGITFVTLEGTFKINSTQRHVFQDESVLSAGIGKSLVPEVTYSGPATKMSLYIDLGQDGSFDAADLMGYGLPQQLPTISIPSETVPGVYRARVEAEGDCAVDFLVNLHKEECEFFSEILNGNIWAPGYKPLPLSVAYWTAVSVEPRPTLEGFKGDRLTVRHGQNIFGEQYVSGNRQWEEFEIPAEGVSELYPYQINGQIYVYGEYADTPEGEWTLIWSDEFTADEMDSSKWSYHPRYSSAWNRFCAVGDERPVVNKFDQGMYKSYCMKTPEEFLPSETKEMISGAIYTHNKFYLTGGYIEARCKTLPHKGNFQAFWLMPSNQSAGWPSCGEIDIWEQINTEKVAYGTLHHAWRYPNNATVQSKYGSISKACPFSGGTKTGVDAALWHTYAIDWDSEHITWYVDGQPYATAQNPHYSEGKWTEEVTWPFDKAFYIICNQSVGNGGWAANPDLDFVYQTDFDYVRAYQKKDNLNYYSTKDGHVSGITDVIPDGDLDCDAPVEYYNLQGIRVKGDTPGVYIRRQGGKTSKILVK